MKSLNINRRFERMFPWIAADNRAFNNDLEAQWRTVAEQNQRIRMQQNSRNEITWTLLWHMKYDFEIWKEEFIPAPWFDHLASDK